MARSNLTAHSCTEIRLAPEKCAERRIVALRAAIADGSYRVDPEAIADKLINAVRLLTQRANLHH